MLQRQTQTAAFWRDQFEVSSSDLDFIYNLLLDMQAPRSTTQLAVTLIDNYLRRENAKIESELSKGETYMPKERYETDQVLVFPALDFAIGKIIGVRPGQNPEYGDFEVIKVSFAETDSATDPEKDSAASEADGTTRICRKSGDASSSQSDEWRQSPRQKHTPLRRRDLRTISD